MPPVSLADPRGNQIQIARVRDILTLTIEPLLQDLKSISITNADVIIHASAPFCLQTKSNLRARKDQDRWFFCGKFAQSPRHNLWNYTKFCSTIILKYLTFIGAVVPTDKNTSKYKEFIVNCNTKTHYIIFHHVNSISLMHIVTFILIIIIKLSLQWLDFIVW